MSISPRVSRIVGRQSNTRGRGKPGRQRGIALFVGLVFLVMLTLVSLIVMRGTLLEMRMTTATARHEQAFEASETGRTIPEAVLALHVFNRGWPQSWGGTVPDAMFDLNTTFANRMDWVAMLNPGTTSGLGIRPACGGTGLVIFYMAAPCATQPASANYSPSSWAPSVIFNLCDPIGSACSGSEQTVNNISIVRDGVSLNQGSGAAQAQGYSSIGVGSSKGGSALLLQIQSKATVPGNGVAATIAQYKLNVTN